ncbi:DUF3800 domain-containing protein [candidate division KSB1 bacterium]|nr:DUF3800 domain-containing protein [candidate division KSB1 bacterium]
MKFEIYCDECRPELFTSQRKSGFLSIGGLWLPAEERQNINNTIKSIKAKHNVWGEIKWNKVSSSKLNFYKAIVEFFFKNPNLRFRTILVDSSRVDLLQFHENDAELGFYKFYYQLIHHWILDFNKYFIFVDKKTNRLPDRLTILKKVLNKSNLSSQIISIQSLPSNEVNLIQIVDLLTGAVNASFNQSHTSRAKIDLIHFIEKFIKHKISPTTKGEEKFNIFKINLQGGW